MNSDYFTEIPFDAVSKHPVLSNWEENYIFRGQADAAWELETSLDRFLSHIPISLRARVEPHLIEEFQRRYCNYAQSVPSFDNRIEWWALMQHYGAPTRLFDWTYSFNIALFFAIEDLDSKAEKSAVWAIDADWLREKHKKFSRLTSLLKNDPHMKELKTFQAFDGKPLILRLNPFLLHERLSIQQGCFLISGKSSIPFVENLLALSNRKDLQKHLYKIVVPKDDEKRKKVLESLFRSNITRASLFPGLDGFAHSLKTTSYSMPRLLKKPELLRRIKKSWKWK